MLATADPIAFVLRWLFLGTAVAFWLMVPLALALGL